MNRTPPQNDNSWERDPVWKLLAQAPLEGPGPRFVDNTVRAARLVGQPAPWWRRLLAPAPLAGLAAAGAALVITVISLSGPAPEPAGPAVAAAFDSDQADAIQEIAETETLIAAADHLEDFSDTELVSLIGF